VTQFFDPRMLELMPFHLWKKEAKEIVSFASNHKRIINI